ncbi:hypothetical protein DYB35_011918 [Aphanomyces astaci]|uniref:Retroviral polymerase SH3-like domain-containing protein n=1 Tax=Aphanomyces astaci TaxID=112090 RepID=A0A418CTU5_APHAT|nr:hypothetical protein DYB35_011918 [Aphanomyces astaci]
MARSMLLHGNLPQFLWGEAISHAVLLMNILPSTTIGGDTPYRLWHQSHPDYARLRVFGCVAYAHVNIPMRVNKLSPRGMLCMYIGLPETSRGFKLLNIDTHYVLTSRDVTFVEHQFPLLKSVEDVKRLRSEHPQRNCFTVDQSSPPLQPSLPSPLGEAAPSTTPTPLPSFGEAFSWTTPLPSFGEAVPSTSPSLGEAGTSAPTLFGEADTASPLPTLGEALLRGSTGTVWQVPVVHDVPDITPPVCLGGILRHPSHQSSTTPTPKRRRTLTFNTTEEYFPVPCTSFHEKYRLPYSGICEYDIHLHSNVVTYDNPVARNSASASSSGDSTCRTHRRLPHWTRRTRPRDGQLSCLCRILRTPQVLNPSRRRNTFSSPSRTRLLQRSLDLQTGDEIASQSVVA